MPPSHRYFPCAGMLDQLVRGLFGPNAMNSIMPWPLQWHGHGHGLYFWDQRTQDLLGQQVGTYNFSLTCLGLYCWDQLHAPRENPGRGGKPWGNPRVNPASGKYQISQHQISDQTQNVKSLPHSSLSTVSSRDG